MDWKEKLGAEIRKARMRSRMTQEKLREELLGNGLRVCLATIGYYERGERAPDFDDLRKIARVLKTDHFEIDENLRIEFKPNGRPRPEIIAQQLKLAFDENGRVDIRIEPVPEGLIIKKVSA